MIQVNTKEIVTVAYGMGNVPSGTNFSGLCQAFYTRDIRAEEKHLDLVISTGIQSQFNPDVFWLANTSRRLLIPTELQRYDCLLNKGGGSFLSSKVLDLMPSSPDSIRIPALMITAIDSVNSPILRQAAVVIYSTGLPVMLIAGLVQAWKLAFKIQF